MTTKDKKYPFAFLYYGSIQDARIVLFRYSIFNELFYMYLLRYLYNIHASFD